MLLNCGVGEDSWESLGQKGNPTNQSYRKSVLNIHCKDQCWCWNSNTLATWCKELTHLKRPWCWKILKAGREGDDRGWDGCMPSPMWWTWVWVGSGHWWWTGKPGVLQFMGSLGVRHNWVNELNWTDLKDSLVAQLVKNLPTILETWIWSLDWANPLEKETATHSSILAWRIPMDRGAWLAIAHRVAKSQTWLSN